MTKPIAGIVLAILSILLIGLTALILRFITPMFIETFSSFGADLPLLTLMVLNHQYLLLLPVLASSLLIAKDLFMLFTGKQHKLAFWRWVIIQIILTLLIAIIFLTALYLPIFNLGKAV